MNRMFLNPMAVLAALAMAGCGGAATEMRSPTDDSARSKELVGASSSGKVDAKNRCSADVADREVSEYDTSGDNKPDVRKVFMRISSPPAMRLVMICREADLNADGSKDVIRYYDDEGRTLREEADRDLDGTMDMQMYFENGVIVREEADTNGDGKVDMKVFYEAGQPLRTERDLLGRSTALEWKPNRWEYFEEGRLVRMGTDLTGDSQVDRWDRDYELKPPLGSTAQLETEEPESESTTTDSEASNSEAETKPADDKTDGSKKTPKK